MSYDIRLTDPITHEVLNIDHPHFMRGGMYAINGTTELYLNVTYNYSKHYYKDNVLGEKGIRSIYGKTGAQSIPILTNAINNLNDDVSNNYWDATEGNAKRALIQLKTMAEMRPDGIWDGD